MPDIPHPTYSILAGHMLSGVLSVNTVAMTAAAVSATVWGGAAALGVALGGVLTVFFFTITSLAISWADVLNRSLMLPIGVGVYIGKVFAIGALVVIIAESDWSGFTGVLWGLVIGTFTWITSQVVWALMRARRTHSEVNSQRLTSVSKDSAQ